MSSDARNSLIAWSVVLTAAVLVWLSPSFDFLPTLPDWTNWIPPVVLPILILWEVVRAYRADRRKTGERG